MRVKTLIFSILFLLFAIVAVQNTAVADINLIFWKIQWPLIVLIMVIFLVGLVMGLMVSSLYERKKKKAESSKADELKSRETEELKKVEKGNKNEIN
jgi:uncharacterized integral membrane protein